MNFHRPHPLVSTACLHVARPHRLDEGLDGIVLGHGGVAMIGNRDDCHLRWDNDGPSLPMRLTTRGLWIGGDGGSGTWFRPEQAIRLGPLSLTYHWHSPPTGDVAWSATEPTS